MKAGIVIAAVTSLMLVAALALGAGFWALLGLWLLSGPIGLALIFSLSKGAKDQLLSAEEYLDHGISWQHFDEQRAAHQNSLEN